MRRYGGVVWLLPFTYCALLIGSLSLMAVPYLTGWYSKDGILEVALGGYLMSGAFVYIVGTLVAGLTAFYSVRLIILTFLVQPRSERISYVNLHEVNWYVIVPLGTLSAFAILLGYVSSDLFRGMGSDFLSSATPMSPGIVASVDAEFGSVTLFKLMPLMATILGLTVAYWAYMTEAGVIGVLNALSFTSVAGIYRFFVYQWNFDALIIDGFIIKGLRAGHNLSKVLDRGILEALGPYGLRQSFMGTGGAIGRYNTGILTDYAMYIVLGMLAAILFFTVPSLGIITTSTGLDASMASLVMVTIVNGVSAYMVLKTPLLVYPLVPITIPRPPIDDYFYIMLITVKGSWRT